MITRKITYSSLLAFIIFLIAGISQPAAAQDNTLYYLTNVPQSQLLNPATQPACGLFLNLPVVSPTITFENTDLTFQDLFYVNPETGKTHSPLTSRADADAFLNKLSDVNVINTNITTSLAFIGFRSRQMYFSLNITPREIFSISVPKDLFEFILIGDTTGKEYDLSAMNIEAQSVMEYGLGISRKIGDNLVVGIRPKFFSGIATASTDINQLSLRSSKFQTVLEADMQMNIAAPGFDIPVDEEGKFDPEVNLDSILEANMSNTAFYQDVLLGNYGWGIDIGVHYRPIEAVQFSASIIDLGYIKWKTHTHTMSMDGKYSWKGYDVNYDNDSVDYFENLLDSLGDVMQIEEKKEAFKTSFTPRLFLGLRYFINNDLDVSLLSHTKFYESRIAEDLTVAANWRPSNVFNISASYSLLDGNFSSFGAGIGLRVGMFHLFTVVDDISLQAYKMESLPISIPNAQQSYNIKFGFNLMFGCNQKKKLQDDKPLMYSNLYY